MNLSNALSSFKYCKLSFVLLLITRIRYLSNVLQLMADFNSQLPNYVFFKILYLSPISFESTSSVYISVSYSYSYSDDEDNILSTVPSSFIYFSVTPHFSLAILSAPSCF